MSRCRRFLVNLWDIFLAFLITALIVAPGTALGLWIENYSAVGAFAFLFVYLVIALAAFITIIER